MILAVSLLRQLVAGVSMWRFRIKQRPVFVGFVVNKVVLEQVFLSPAVIPYHYCTSALYSFVCLLSLLYHLGKRWNH